MVLQHVLSDEIGSASGMQIYDSCSLAYHKGHTELRSLVVLLAIPKDIYLFIICILIVQGKTMWYLGQSSQKPCSWSSKFECSHASTPTSDVHVEIQSSGGVGRFKDGMFHG